MAENGKDRLRPFMKPTIALVRGKFLNQYEMQVYEPLVNRYDITAFGSKTSFHDSFAFPVVKCWSAIDFSGGARSRSARRIQLALLNRLFVDAHYLLGLEKALNGFDIAHTAETYYRYTSQCLNAKRDGRVKAVIATVLETIPYNNEGIWGRKAMKERARNEVDHFIAITKRAKDALIIEGTNPNKISVIPYGIDTERFTVAHAKKDARRVDILYVGRLEKEKGVLDLLEAFKILSDKRVYLTIVGSGSLTLPPMDHVTFIESSYDDMPKVYQKADIFVAPSKPHFAKSTRGTSYMTWEEQYNIALLEAQASGLAIITTNSGAIPENVGNAALLIKPNDIQALVVALRLLITDSSLRVSLGNAARYRAETVHDGKIISKKIDFLYQEVLSSAKAKKK